MSIPESVVVASEHQPEQEPTAQQAPLDASLDAWGNAILGAPGPMGQYRIRSARDWRILRVCGEAKSQKHLLFWDYDAGERRLVCRLCFPRSPEELAAAAETADQDPHQDPHQEADHV